MVQQMTGVEPEGVNIYDLRDDVFKVGSSLTPVTNGCDGIFIPFSIIPEHKNQEGTLLFIDLEGSNNPFSARQPIELQVMALMSTSVLVLVDRGNPTIKSVLELAQACTEVIQRYMKENASDLLTLKPNWLWLLNDTDLVDTVDDPLEMLLAGNDDPTAVALREQLETCFDVRSFDCLPNLHLADKYQENLKVEIDWLLSNLGILKLGGIPLGGKEYLQLINQATRNINENGVVDVEPAFLAIARTRLVEVREDAYKNFLEQCPEVTKYSPSLSRNVSNLKSTAMKNYDAETEPIRASAGAGAIYTEERNSLEADIDTKVAHLEDMNNQARKTRFALCAGMCAGAGATGGICACLK
eukprot:GHVN01099570.1.p1 GENE.GHVN01099570.1~~GHVN01099570.1.p1  ORF type:complete len:356 (-),score=38.11 GHVN01099570.1:176-1243(-)